MRIISERMFDVQKEMCLCFGRRLYTKSIKPNFWRYFKILELTGWNVDSFAIGTEYIERNYASIKRKPTM